MMLKSQKFSPSNLMCAILEKIILYLCAANSSVVNSVHIIIIVERDSVDGMVQSRECHDLLYIICSEA